MSLVYLDSDPWFVEYDACETLYRDIVEQLNARSNETWNSEKYSKISATVRFRIKQYATEVQQLKNKLEQSKSLTLEEAERRSRLVELLQSRNIQLLERFNDRSSKDQRDLLFRSKSGIDAKGGNKAFKDLGTTSWLDDDDDDPLPSEPLINASVSNSEIKTKQQRLLEEQERGLEGLSKIISRQKDIAVTIGNEVDLQNDLVDDLSGRMERVNTTIQSETSHVVVIAKKDSTFRYWVVIMVLFVSILIVIFIK